MLYFNDVVYLHNILYVDVILCAHVFSKYMYIFHVCLNICTHHPQKKTQLSVAKKDFLFSPIHLAINGLTNGEALGPSDGFGKESCCLLTRLF